MGWLALLALSSCGGSGAYSAGPTATVPRSTSTTDPYAVPAIIDVPYLNRVFAALKKVNGDATRLIVANRRITPEAADLLHAVYADDEFKAQAEDWNNLIDGGLKTFRPNPGDRTTHVRQLLIVRSECLALSVDRDYSALAANPEAGASALVSLVPRPPNAVNPTPWAISAQYKSGKLPCG